jgi:hypothetical protein
MPKNLRILWLVLGAALAPILTHAGYNNENIDCRAQFSIPLERAYFKYARSEGCYTPLGCQANTKRLIKYFKDNVEGFDMDHAKVLLIYHYKPTPNEEPTWFPNLAYRNERHFGEALFAWHVVLQYDGIIYDLTSPPDAEALPVEQYFESQFLIPEETDKEREQFNAVRIQDRDTLFDEIRIRTVSGTEYFGEKGRTLLSVGGDKHQLWVTGDKDIPSLSLREYLVANP